jgi:hypothetical protein
MLQTIAAYVDANRERFLEELESFLRIPSISTLPENRGDIGRAAAFVAEGLRAAGLEVSRLKTDTPPRVNGRTVNWSVLEPQPGDPEPRPFSFSTDRITQDQLPCYMTYTNPRTHQIIAAAIDRAPLYDGQIKLLSVNNYDFPSDQPNDRYISEKWFVREGLNLEAETLAQLEAALSTGEYEFYAEGSATQTARLDYVRERLRLLFVGITRAKKELLITWNTGRQGELTPALPFVALQGWWETRG